MRMGVEGERRASEMEMGSLMVRAQGRPHCLADSMVARWRRASLVSRGSTMVRWVMRGDHEVAPTWESWSIIWSRRSPFGGAARTWMAGVMGSARRG